MPAVADAPDPAVADSAPLPDAASGACDPAISNIPSPLAPTPIAVLDIAARIRTAAVALTREEVDEQRRCLRVLEEVSAGLALRCDADVARRRLGLSEVIGAAAPREAAEREAGCDGPPLATCGAALTILAAESLSLSLSGSLWQATMAVPPTALPATEASPVEPPTLSSFMLSLDRERHTKKRDALSAARSVLPTHHALSRREIAADLAPGLRRMCALEETRRAMQFASLKRKSSMRQFRHAVAEGAEETLLELATALL